MMEQKHPSLYSFFITQNYQNLCFLAFDFVQVIQMKTSQKPIPRKPLLSSQKKEVVVVSFDRKVAKAELFYRYHVSSIYRQLKTPIYDNLLQLRKDKKAERIPPVEKTVEDLVQILYKYGCLNSKYRHREKMRFERAPLLKYIKFDFGRMRELLKTKKFMKNYEDLHEDDESDEDQQSKKKEYDHDPSFGEQTVLNFKKKHSIKGKIVIAKGYDDLKACLVDEFGWVEVEDYESNIYDLKFMSKKKDLDYVNLLEGQYINHFQENKMITAKFGLCRNIRNLTLLGRDPNIFFPRCYDINDVNELEDFYEDFKYTQLKSYLFKFIKNQGRICKDQIKILKLAMEVLERELAPFQKKLEWISKGKPLVVSTEEWGFLQEWKKAEQGQPVIEQELCNEATKLFENLKKVDLQWSLNCDNIWIVKPASMSRGRGIKTFNDLNEILEYIVGCEISWVVQKYIQRPLIIRKKKFDIRQWVLWTDFKPFRVWMYEQAYIRFCAQTYTPEDLKNRKIHLTNNSVTKGVNYQNDGIQGNMMDEETFSAQLQHLFGKEIFKSIIKPQMKKIAYQSLESVLENVQYRKNSFQIFGFDFMVDEEFKVWLIEINSSPTMEYSTPVTTKLVKRGMHDLGLLVQNYITKGKQYKANNSKELYGGWKLICQ